MPLESMARMMESPLPRQSPSTPSLRITALKPDDADLLPSPRAGAICRSSRTRSSGATAVLEAAPAKAPMAMVVGTDAFSFFFADIGRPFAAVFQYSRRPGMFDGRPGQVEREKRADRVSGRPLTYLSGTPLSQAPKSRYKTQLQLTGFSVSFLHDTVPRYFI